MKEKYRSVGLDYDLIVSKYPNINEYESIVNAYFEDEFFVKLKEYLDDEDYELAKDAVKGLYILAEELYLFPLYMALLDIYEDIEDITYDDLVEKIKNSELHPDRKYRIIDFYNEWDVYNYDLSNE